MSAKIIGQQPKVNVVDLRRQDLPDLYIEMKKNHDLLRRIEVDGLSKGWTDLEIRTAQLQTAVNSCASLQKRLQEMESGLSRTIKG